MEGVAMRLEIGSREITPAVIRPIRLLGREGCAPPLLPQPRELLREGRRERQRHRVWDGGSCSCVARPILILASATVCCGTT